MPSFVASDSQNFEDGVYRARLTAMEDAESSQDGGAYVKWTFEILDEEYEGQTLRANSSVNFGPRAKARQWAEALMGRRIEGGENISEEHLVGCEGDLMVRNQETDNGTFARVESVNPIRRKKSSVADKQQAASEAKTSPQATGQADAEEDIEASIPF